MVHAVRMRDVAKRGPLLLAQPQKFRDWFQKPETELMQLALWCCFFSAETKGALCIA